MTLLLGPTAGRRRWHTRLARSMSVEEQGPPIHVTRPRTNSGPGPTGRGGALALLLRSQASPSIPPFVRSQSDTGINRRVVPASSPRRSARRSVGAGRVVSVPSSSVLSASANTKEFKDTMKAGEANILVAVRCRPLLSKEVELGYRETIRILDKKVVVVMDPSQVMGTSTDYLRRDRPRERQYAFDYAFDESIGQEEVYKSTSKFLVQGVMAGFNATVFAYGATGSGKTYTMLGTEKKPGLMLLMLRDVFRAVEDNEGKYTITISYLEIYNEVLRDLLVPKSEALELREDPQHGVSVPGVAECGVSSVDRVMEMLQKGNQRRTTEPTAANETSSRSHAVLQVIVEHRSATKDAKERVRISKLSLVDLAGSERAATTENRGIRLTEGCNINRSLLALGNCINALRAEKKSAFVPYRDSKLTRLLKDSLGGNCRTVMIATISPGIPNCDETNNTLKYANRAKEIKTRVSRNVLTVSYHIAEYTRVISDLRREVSQLKERLTRAKETQSSEVEDQTDTEDIQQLRNEIITNFEEQIKLRKDLIDLEDTDLDSSLALRQARQKLALAQEENTQDLTPHERESEEELQRATRQEIAQAVRAQNMLHDMRATLELRLRQEEARGKALQGEVRSRVPNENKRNMLELEYRTCVLDLENAQLHETAFIRQSMLKQKEMRIRELEFAVEEKDRTIRKQERLLQQAGILFEGFDEEGDDGLESIAVLPPPRQEDRGSGGTPQSEEGVFHVDFEEEDTFNWLLETVDRKKEGIVSENPSKKRGPRNARANSAVGTTTSPSHQDSSVQGVRRIATNNLPSRGEGGAIMTSPGPGSRRLEDLIPVQSEEATTHEEVTSESCSHSDSGTNPKRGTLTRAMAKKFLSLFGSKPNKNHAG